MTKCYYCSDGNCGLYYPHGTCDCSCHKTKKPDECVSCSRLRTSLDEQQKRINELEIVVLNQQGNEKEMSSELEATKTKCETAYDQGYINAEKSERARRDEFRKWLAAYREVQSSYAISYQKISCPIIENIAAKMDEVFGRAGEKE